ncbi:hypothetical protein ColLi_12341 [Colletotrichum liriopes]|uniref:Uncharacterized protein n=1 Tax=Colletotrichum liriopes TaxID=708192 RepID=A0AA37LZJ5_9PEZI|nr:hypothetical protein ColLi_12341 [Colletotrichum liriopes]
MSTLTQKRQTWREKLDNINRSFNTERENVLQCQSNEKVHLFDDLDLEMENLKETEILESVRNLITKGDAE